MAIVQRMTYEDLLAQPDDGCQHELVRGEILQLPPPKGVHGIIEMALAEYIGRYLYNRALAQGWEESQGLAARGRLVGYLAGGEAGIRFSLPDDPDQTRGVDLFYLSPEQVARCERFISNDEYIPEVPVLVVEVISPSETALYVDEKLHDFLAGGARMVWLIYRKTRTIKVYLPDGSMRTITRNDVLDGGDVLPGFSLALANIFP